jgi:hypothetical protein
MSFAFETGKWERTKVLYKTYKSPFQGTFCRFCMRFRAGFKTPNRKHPKPGVGSKTGNRKCPKMLYKTYKSPFQGTFCRFCMRFSVGSYSKGGPPWREPKSMTKVTEAAASGLG